MMLTRSEVVALHKDDCMFLMYGHCETRACLVRGGWNGGSTEGIIPTCPYRQTVDTDTTLRAELTEARNAALMENYVMTPLTQEQTQQRINLLALLDENAALRAELTEARNAALKEGIMSGQLRASLEAVTKERDELREDLEASDTPVIDAQARTIEGYQQQLAQVMKERDRLANPIEHADYFAGTILNLEQQLTQSQARVQALEAALREASERLHELNPCNYTHEDVLNQNLSVIGAWELLHAALTPTPNIRQRS